MDEAGISITGCRFFDGGPCEESGGIEGGQRGDLVVEDERELGTAQDNVVEFLSVTLVADTPEGTWLGGLPEELELISVGHEFVKQGQKVTAVRE